VKKSNGISAKGCKIVLQNAPTFSLNLLQPKAVPALQHSSGKIRANKQQRLIATHSLRANAQGGRGQLISLGLILRV